jgi:hypothetical protein
MAFDLGVVRIRVPPADSLARDIARKLVQRQRNPEALFAGHPAVAGDLFVDSGSRVHRLILLPTKLDVAAARIGRRRGHVGLGASAAQRRRA